MIIDFDFMRMTTRWNGNSISKGRVDLEISTEHNGIMIRIVSDGMYEHFKKFLTYEELFDTESLNQKLDKIMEKLEIEN
ncbi:MAG TPA: hypothetical protein VLE02_02770 [Nitrosarchaeum sp.]|nr:hypothetical protein [Nitrosarchaeum sp.]